MHKSLQSGKGLVLTKRSILHLGQKKRTGAVPLTLRLCKMFSSQAVNHTDHGNQWQTLFGTESNVFETN